MINITVFTAPNCSPCQMLKKELEGFDNVQYINVMEDFDTALEFQVRKSPTTINLKDDKEVGRFVGFKTKKEITSYLESI